MPGELVGLVSSNSFISTIELVWPSNLVCVGSQASWSIGQFRGLVGSLDS